MAGQEKHVLGEQDPGGGQVREHWRGNPGIGLGLAIALLVGLAIAASVTALALLASSDANAANHARDSYARESSDKSWSAGRGHAIALQVTSVTPAGGSVGVSGEAAIRVVFSASVAPGSPMPVLSPSVPGRWQSSGRVLSFVPDLPFAASSRMTLRIPAGPAGVRSAAGGLLARAVRVSFRTAPYSRLRLAQLLGKLGYLPVSWQAAAPSGGLAGVRGGGDLAAQMALAYHPSAGLFTAIPGYPASLRAQWRAAGDNLVIRGAVMAFQAQHRMAVTGAVSRGLWHALFLAAVSGQRNAVGYTYAIASKGSPETLTIWHDGRVVLRSLANTGIAVAPTAAGTYPVYLRLRFQVMQGTNPDGSHYADPVSFVAYFDAGDAVHYFPRYSYGYPQSLGCVELPYDDAERAWPYLTYGSLITVTG